MNIITRYTSVVLACATLLACNEQPRVSADDVGVKWVMGENHYQGKSQFISSFILANTGKSEIGASGWTVYFNFPRLVKPETVTGNVKIKHINGDFYAMAPNANFKLLPGDSVRIHFVSSDWAINESDAPAGLYMVFDKDGKEQNPEVIANYAIAPFIDDKQSRRSPDDNTPVVSAALLYEKYKDISPVEETELQAVVPAPVRNAQRAGVFVLDDQVKINASAELAQEEKFLESTLNDLLSDSLRGGEKIITLKIGSLASDETALNEIIKTEGREAYKLEITPSEITITGSDKAGVFYGIQTLKGLFPVDVWNTKNKSIQLKAATIIDFPRFSYRGIHLDVARNFQKKSTVLKLLDQMSFYKLNKLHFHLSDDEGWRVELESLPELTDIGGTRGHDSSGKGMVPSFGSGPFAQDENSNGSGFYSAEEFVEILKYANARHIEVIPKIDMPGHARAAIKAMDARYEKYIKVEKYKEARQFLLRDINDSSTYRSVQQWNDNVISVCQESTYNFIKTVVRDFKALYKKANVPFNTFHIGADEVPHGVWEKSAECMRVLKDQNLEIGDLQQYFFRRVSRILLDEGLSMGGWEEIALKKIRKGNSITLEANPEFVKANFKPYVWNSVWGWDQEDVGYKLANAGYKIVLGNVTNLYFDLAYEKHPKEPGYYWGAFVDTKKVYEFDPYNIYEDAKEDKFGKPLDREMIARKVRLTNEGKANILGLQGQLWSENIKGEKSLEYMAFPKLLALAERAWVMPPTWTAQSGENRERSFTEAWNRFVNKIGATELPRLDASDVNYRISPPGAIIQNDSLFANVEFPGLVIRYTTDGSEPTISSPIYTRPVKMESAVVKLKTFNTINRSSRTIIAKVE
jgi:hexosaminidase